MHCNNCGSKLNDGAKYCDKCGMPTNAKKASNMKAVIIILATLFVLALAYAILQIVAENNFYKSKCASYGYEWYYEKQNGNHYCCLTKNDCIHLTRYDK